MIVYYNYLMDICCGCQLIYPYHPGNKDIDHAYGFPIITITSCSFCEKNFRYCPYCDRMNNIKYKISYYSPDNPNNYMEKHICDDCLIKVDYCKTCLSTLIYGEKQCEFCCNEGDVLLFDILPKDIKHIVAKMAQFYVRIPYDYILKHDWIMKAADDFFNSDEYKKRIAISEPTVEPPNREMLDYLIEN